MIDKEVLLSRIKHANMFGYNVDCPEWVLKIIAEMPEEVPARWVCVRESEYKCSRCGYMEHGYKAYFLYSYCPNCGARIKMER